MHEYPPITCNPVRPNIKSVHAKITKYVIKNISNFFWVMFSIAALRKDEKTNNPI